MRHAFKVPVHRLLESCAESIRGLEAHEASPAADRVRELIQSAGRLLGETAHPAGLFETVTTEEFVAIHAGDGGNDGATPVEQVIEDAAGLALFAVTLGREVSERIDAHFEAGEMAEAYLLDQVASFATDELAHTAARHFLESCGPVEGAAVLPYSPGFCGWNVSGQRSLFERLIPGEIGITLTESCLMQPMKSVSGALILAPVPSHDISPAFPCCATCTTLDCQERVASLKSALAADGGRQS
jgi:hypothetical protein